MEFVLDLAIDTTDLRILKGAGQRIILAKPVASASPNVAWISFDPFENNTVSWQESYGLYASNSSFQSGAQINKISSSPFPSEDGKYYSFRSDATFYGPNSGSDAPPLGSFRVFNEMPSSTYPALLFGLTQSAIVNNTSADFRPLNANSVPANQSGTFTPTTTVYAWLQSNLVSGSVIVDVSSKSTKVTFGDGITNQALKYDPAKGMFVPITPKGEMLLSGTRNVQLLERWLT